VALLAVSLFLNVNFDPNSESEIDLSSIIASNVVEAESGGTLTLILRCQKSDDPANWCFNYSRCLRYYGDATQLPKSRWCIRYR